VQPTAHDPVHGVAYAFTADGQNLIVDSWFEPGAKLPEHFHPIQEERWSVVEGRATIQNGDFKGVVVPEDGAQIVKPGTKHSIEALGEPAHLRAVVLPALSLQEFLEDSAAAAREGLFVKGGIPRNLRGARWAATFLERHREETVMTFPPRFVQSAMIALLAK
jgi:quercetin dioxygenase-like cupin family protein